jgi:hypothetical protein
MIATLNHNIALNYLFYTTVVFSIESARTLFKGCHFTSEIVTFCI